MKHRVLDIQQKMSEISPGGRTMSGILRDRVHDVPDGGGFRPMALSYTPPVDCWWKVHFNQSNVGHFSADAWRWCYFFIHISPPPANFRSNQSTSVAGPAGNTVSFPDGMTAGSVATQISGSTYHFRQFTKLWQLTKGVTYRCTAGYQTQDTAGTWSYHTSPDHMHMHAVAIEK